MGPQTIEQWRAVEDELEAGDILLFHDRLGLAEKLIHKKTGSYWNHVALVFKPKKDLVFGGPLIVEAGPTSSVEIHQLKRYTDNLTRYDIGVMRYPGMTDADGMKLVMNFMLDNIDVKYAYGSLVFIFLDKIMLRWLSPESYGKVLKFLIRPGTFVCSTFVHRAFHLVDTSPHEHVENVSQTMEEYYTPGDLSSSERFVWIFNRHL